MSILKKLTRKRNNARSTIITGEQLFGELLTSGYTSLDQNPEVVTCARKIADLISSMTIHLMENTKNGDQRIVNELSKKIDINPNQYMTRKAWMDIIVMNLVLHGSGNSVVIPKTKNGLLADLIPIRPGDVTFRENGYGYMAYINGVAYEPVDILHFKLNPDKYHPWKGKGYAAPLRDIVDNLQQAAVTERGFLTDKWKPAVIVKVDSGAEELSSEKGRDKLLEEYIKTSEAGKPWVIPVDLMDVATVKPLTLADLAIKDTVQLNKTTVASIMGVPAFVLGVGTFNAAEWNNFINSTILPIATEIQQEMTKKLILSPKWYFKFNPTSLYAYDLEKKANVYSNLYVRGICDGNEVRDQIGLSPRDGLGDLVILENYIPLDKVGDQLKLKQEGENE